MTTIGRPSQVGNVTLRSAVGHLYVNSKRIPNNGEKKACIYESLRQGRTFAESPSFGTTNAPVGNKAERLRLSKKGQTPHINVDSEFPLSQKYTRRKQIKKEPNRPTSSASKASAERPSSASELFVKSVATGNINGKPGRKSHKGKGKHLQQSIYSRHMRNSSPERECFNDSDDVQNYNSIVERGKLLLQDAELSAIAKEDLESGQHLTSSVNLEDHTEEVQMKDKRSITTFIDAPSKTDSDYQEFEYQSQTNDEQDKGELQTVLEDFDMSCNEKEFIRQVSDPRLKTSLQNIIKKRRDSVCLPKAPELAEVQEFGSKSNSPSKNHKSLQTKEKQGSFTDGARTLAEENPRLNKPKETAEDSERRSNRPFSSRAGSIYSNGQGNNQQSQSRFSVHSGVSTSVYSGISAATAWNKRTPVSSSRSSRSSSRKQKGGKILETEETRIILPTSAKGYRPCLSRQSTRTFSAGTSSALSRTVVKKSSALSETEAIREFLLMYARIKSNKETKDDKPFTYEYQEPVQMMSSVPELVVKSAIGQFLTEVFPSQRSTNHTAGGNRQSKEQKYEELQRTRLLKIKTCMKHLASMV